MNRVLGHATYGNNLVLVDTPGFDDTNKEDKEILEMINQWMKKVYVGLSAHARIMIKLFNPSYRLGANDT